ncbi:hypothetical protein FACS1894211_04580 [Clostridia bacterium]|nr:hypothetical protein FACS1894211_04580 [Clostridia bacterium]
MKGSAGVSMTPAVKPASASSRRAASRALETGARGSIFSHRASDIAVTVKVTETGLCSAMRRKISLSRATKSDFVVILIPKR